MEEEEKKRKRQEMTYLLFQRGTVGWTGNCSVRGDRDTSATPVFQRRHTVPACTVEISVIVRLMRLVRDLPTARRVSRVNCDDGSACVGRPGQSGGLAAERKTEEKKRTYAWSSHSCHAIFESSLAWVRAQRRIRIPSLRMPTSRGLLFSVNAP